MDYFLVGDDQPFTYQPYKQAGSWYL